MPRPLIRPFHADDVPSAAALLAARHGRDRARFAFFRGGEDQAAAEALIRPLVANPNAAGVAATRDGRLVGYLFGEKLLFGPTDMMALFLPPHSISMPVEGSALAEGEDCVSLLREMYAALADGWVRAGFLDHTVEIVAGNGDVQEAWVTLGFGRHITAATRPTGDAVAGLAPATVEVHRAGAEDIGVVMDLARQLNEHHSLAPMFWPVVHTAEAAARGFNQAVLDANETPFFVAYQRGEPVGLQTFLRPGFTPGVVDHANDVYLFEGIVGREARSGGIGTALLDHSMRWARDAGFSTCTLHFAAQNFSGAPFWLGQGFAPITHTMRRIIDHRINWNR